jgi:hypothetical protein
LEAGSALIIASGNDDPIFFGFRVSDFPSDLRIFAVQSAAKENR